MEKTIETNKGSFIVEFYKAEECASKFSFRFKNDPILTAAILTITNTKQVKEKEIFFCLRGLVEKVNNLPKNFRENTKIQTALATDPQFKFLEEGDDTNYIGLLNEYCQKNHLSIDRKNTTGQGTGKNWNTVNIKVGNLSEEATSERSNIAAQIAAKKLLDLLPKRTRPNRNTDYNGSLKKKKVPVYNGDPEFYEKHRDYYESEGVTKDDFDFR